MEFLGAKHNFIQLLIVFDDLLFFDLLCKMFTFVIFAQQIIEYLNNTVFRLQNGHDLILWNMNEFDVDVLIRCAKTILS